MEDEAFRFGDEINHDEEKYSSPQYSTSSDSNIACVMMTNVTTPEEQIANLTKAVEGLTKHVQEQATLIAKLMKKADDVDDMHQIGE